MAMLTTGRARAPLGAASLVAAGFWALLISVTLGPFIQRRVALPLTTRAPSRERRVLHFGAGSVCWCFLPRFGVSAFLTRMAERARENAKPAGRMHRGGGGRFAASRTCGGGTPLVKAIDKIVANAKKIAAHLLEAAGADIEFADGKFSVAGTDRDVPFAQVAFAAYVPHNYPIDTLEPGPNETAFYDPINFTA